MMWLYHGSDHAVERPQYGAGKEDNDYGSGFYTTQDFARAAEWASLYGRDRAVVSRYRLDSHDLVVFDLDVAGPLAWIAEVVSHRGVSGATARALALEFVAKYRPDTSGADIMVGYRADDSYGDVIESFFLGELCVDEVKRLFWKGDLGVQVFIKSPRAFERLEYLGHDDVEVQKVAGNTISQARQDAMRFIQNRRVQIARRFVVPEISIADALDHDYVYDAEGDYYARR